MQVGRWRLVPCVARRSGFGVLGSHVLREGAERARGIARPVVDRAHGAVGLLPPALMLLVPVLMITLLRYVFDGSPGTFDSIGASGRRESGKIRKRRPSRRYLEGAARRRTWNRLPPKRSC